jgi:exodeoxyribonuclease-5
MNVIDCAESGFVTQRCCVCRCVIAESASSFWGGEPAHYGCAFSRHKSREPTISVRHVKLTGEQQAVADSIKVAIKRRESCAVHGLAGTGKSTVAAHIARMLSSAAYLCAPTAKAASVLSAKTGLDATTVHSTFYHYVEEIEREDKPPKLVFRPKHAPGSLKGHVLLLDECSMIPRDIAADIAATGITIIAFGDPGQLQPVEGDPFFVKADFTLTEIHRQALESPIIRQAHAVRETGVYRADGDAVRVVNRLSADNLRAADVVLTGRRVTRMRMNAEIRRALGMSSPLPRYGEPLVCLRNARKYGLCNGGIYYASRDLDEGDQTVGISTDGGDVEVYATFLPPGHEYDKLDLPPGGWMTAFAFAYALTVHMAQGSEWDRVLLIDEGAAFRDDRTRWIYTGMTRAKERITIASKGAHA